MKKLPKTVQEKRLAFMKELPGTGPPFWYDKMLSYCQFERLEINCLLKQRISNELAAEAASLPTHNFRPPAWDCEVQQAPLPSSYSVDHVLQAIDCGLLEPILRIAAECGDLHLLDLIRKAFERSDSHHLCFPWMFLAYLGTLNRHTQLVEICVRFFLAAVNTDAGKGGLSRIIEEEVGLAYIVWKYLVQVKDKNEKRSSSSANRAGDENDKGSSADASVQLLAIFLNPKHNHDWTFVHLAATYGDTECLEVLLKRVDGASLINNVTVLEGFTPLHLASFCGHPAIVNLLLKQGSYSSIPQDKILGRSPLHYAAVQGYVDVVQMLLSKWGHMQADLQDNEGWTPLHLAVVSAVTRKKAVIDCLLKEAKRPNTRLKATGGESMIADKFFWRRQIGTKKGSRSRILIPRPNIFASLFWGVSGATPLHLACLYRPIEVPGQTRLTDDMFEYFSGLTGLDHDAQDSEGLVPMDYLHPLETAAKKLSDQLPKGKQRRTVLPWNKVHRMTVELKKATLYYHRYRWVYDFELALLSGDFTSARAMIESCGSPPLHSSAFKKEDINFNTIEINGYAWEHVQWAFNEALCRSSNNIAGLDDEVKILRFPLLLSSDAEDMIVELMHKKVLCGKLTLQRCLRWAIDKRMERLAVELVQESTCELLSAVPGDEGEEAPLVKASKHVVAKEMPKLLAAMELRDDVRRWWYEDRQVYVDYATTLLVGAVLIAGLAFSGWLQPPRGYVDDEINLRRRAMRVFVWSSIVSFILAMGTMVAGAVSAMPFSIGQLVRTRHKVYKAVVAASLLLAASVAALAISFSAAVYAVLPYYYTTSLNYLNAVGGGLLGMLLLWFLSRLQRLRMSAHDTSTPTWQATLFNTLPSIKTSIHSHIKS